MALSTHDLASYALERGDAGARCDVVELVFGRMYTAIAHDAGARCEARSGTRRCALRCGRLLSV